ETLECSHDDADLYRMFWYKQNTNRTIQLVAYSLGKGVTETDPIFDKKKYTMTREEQLKSFLLIKDLRTGDSAVYYCAASSSQWKRPYPAYFGPGTKLTVLDPNNEITKPNVKILPPSSQEGKGKGEKKTLVCVATDFYPDHVTVSWKVNEGVGTDSMAKWDDNTKKYSITSRLRVLNKKWHKESNTFTCTVDFFNGQSNENVTDSINGSSEGIVLIVIYLYYICILS
uniref:Ig-like domain-containing protein n=1 Tax=Esox lucius TaxID=8010 RepID=A0A3P8Z2B7_ESOLU